MSRIFFILPQSATQILSLAGHDFLLHLVAATSSSISGPTRAPAYRGCLRPFREVRLQRDNCPKGFCAGGLKFLMCVCSFVRPVCVRASVRRHLFGPLFGHWYLQYCFK